MGGRINSPWLQVLDLDLFSRLSLVMEPAGHITDAVLTLLRRAAGTAAEEKTILNELIKKVSSAKKGSRPPDG
jgi:hypothetical protein